MIRKRELETGDASEIRSKMDCMRREWTGYFTELCSKSEVKLAYPRETADEWSGRMRAEFLSKLLDMHPQVLDSIND
jgi:hypothetical protein